MGLSLFVGVQIKVDQAGGEASEFSICCDNCDKWFHGKCVKITPARVEGIKRYKCPSWSSKRARP